MTTADPTRALIVEDDPVVARAIARRLLREGYTVSLAGSCRAARLAGSGFHVAVLDLDLPDGSGADLADHLLRQGAVESVVFYSGSLDAAQRERAQQFGHLIDKTEDLELVVAQLEPLPTQHPVSHIAPAMRGRTRSSSSLINRGEAEPRAEGALSSGSSRR
jgi:DNA-binding response OmpR family regulator